jgi:DNA/RNA endonuclease YhcR with UshA esterase domain
MRTLVIAVFSLLISTGTAVAQQSFSTEGFNKNLGKTGTLCDTIYSLHIINDTLTLLNMGAAYPNQKYTVAIKGNKINLDWTTLKGKPLCVTGVFILYKEKPEIEVEEPANINKKQP